jgi:hypothetical protein
MALKKYDIIRRRIENTPFYHYGLVYRIKSRTSQYRVVQFSGNTFKNKRINIANIQEFMKPQREPFEVLPIENRDHLRSRSEIKTLISKFLDTDFGGYDLFQNNCEHFVYHLRYNDEFCKIHKYQLNQLLDTL